MKLWFVFPLESALKSYSTLLLGNVSTRTKGWIHWKYNFLQRHNDIDYFSALRQTLRVDLAKEAGRNDRTAEIRQIN